MAEYTEAQAQADADALIEQVNNQPGFADALASDPRGVLIEAGIPEEIVTELERALVSGSEVEGFAFAPADVTHITGGAFQSLMMTRGTGSNNCCPTSMNHIAASNGCQPQ